MAETDPKTGTPPELPASSKQLEERIKRLEEKKEDDGLTPEEKAELRALLKKPKEPAPAAPVAPTEGKTTAKPGWPW